MFFGFFGQRVFGYYSASFYYYLFSEQVENGVLCSRHRGAGGDRGGWPGWACLFRTGGAVLQCFIY